MSRQHIVLVGACYLDTILSIPHLPEEDTKLRATGLSVRRGGNCPNSLEVLHQLLHPPAGDGSTHIQTHLVSPLPARGCAATAQILSSFGGRGGEAARATDRGEIDFSHCLYREGHDAPASCYVLRSAATGSRTVVNYSGLPEMTVAEFTAVVASLQRDATQGTVEDVARGQSRWWWHFEGRMPATTLQCVRVLKEAFADSSGCDEGGDVLRISVEVEKPGREGLRELAAEADVVFYSRSWAEHSGYSSPEECVQGEKPPSASLAFCTWGADGAACLAVDQDTCLRCSIPEARGPINIVDTVGAGDTFVAGALYGMTRRAGEWDPWSVLRFSVALATRKVQQEGFDNMAANMEVIRNESLRQSSGR